MKRWVQSVLRKKRRGVTLVLTAISIVTLLLFASLAVDVGWICTMTAEMQNTADAGALAGAIDLQDEKSYDAYDHALRIIGRNQKLLGFHSLEDQIVEIGWWNSVTQVFTALDPAEWPEAFAVRVRSVRTDAPLFFAAIIGRTKTTVWREAVAIGSRPCAGIWGLNGVTAGSISTDSFNSTESAYDEFTAYDNGDICSGRQINVHGSFEINGDVMAGFGYEVVVSGGSGEITGITTSGVMWPVPTPPVEFGDVTVRNDNETIGLTDEGRDPWKKTGWNMDIQGTDNLKLAPGKYYLDSFSLSGGSTVTITGETTLYVAGDWDSTGGTIVNPTQDPANLTIISTGAEMKLAGGTDFYGSILAPYADVVFTGGSDIYGAVIGGTLKLSGDTEVHVDESLPYAQPFFEPPPVMLVQ